VLVRRRAQYPNNIFLQVLLDPIHVRALVPIVRLTPHDIVLAQTSYGLVLVNLDEPSRWQERPCYTLLLL